MKYETLDPDLQSAVNILRVELIDSVRESRNYVPHPFISGLCHAIAVLATPDDVKDVTRCLRRACADAIDDICDGTADEYGLLSGEVLRRKIRADLGTHLGFEDLTS